ncbi:hypothetical protein OB920_02280 [Halobacteria archaeon HArc-gm2]|nr:hypothetical protein [Halobacteria archaeon HArc-gm2]
MANEPAGDRRSEVPPLENTAYFAIEPDDGYVRIEQSVGNQTLYTPDEARDIAESILAAVDDANADET